MSVLPSRVRAVRAMLARRAVADEGSAVVEFVILAVVLLVPLIYLVLMLARLQAGTFAVTQAARESGRAFVTAQSEETAPARAETAAGIAFEDQGFGAQGRLEVKCTQTPCLTPEGEIRSVATVVVPLPLVPAFARDVVPLEVPVSASQVSVVPRYEARTP
ncbi:TadE/TadG family type IV pilus assembly protein [Janibacter endophyticus]|uniref:TadE/TadG family type IV pilus assembly protein n=1 Tax=Janibacter endophyticus TaxID=2806261 RepID=UPI0027DBE75F|nr:pilus assembly protein [Janibacter endophyticus]